MKQYSWERIIGSSQLEVVYLVDKLRIIDKRVSIMLPIDINIIISGDFWNVYRIWTVPITENVFHPICDTGICKSRLCITTIPILHVGCGDIEIGSRKISFIGIGWLKAFARISIRSCGITWANKTAIGRGVSNGMTVNNTKWQVASQTIHISVSWPQLKQVRLTVGSIIESTEPTIMKCMWD